MENQLLNHRYQILEKLGEGGFGTTYLAEDTQMPSRRRCVVKQLQPRDRNPSVYQIIQERFKREAAILEELGQHPQIPQLYAYCEDQGQFYLVQEYIDGETLSQIVQNRGIMAEDAVRQILLKLLPVLEYVHNHRIVHRDIKPDNIILRRSDCAPVLIDFGAVKETMGTVITSTGTPKSSIVIGTPGFMSSEQSIGRPVYATDLYALGLTAIYLLTGKIPTELETDPQSGEIIWQPYAPNVKSTLAKVLERAIKSHYQARFLTAKAMLEALQNTDSSTIPIAPSSQPTTIQTMVISPSVTSRPPNWVIGGGIVVLALALWFYYGLNQEAKKVNLDPIEPEDSPKNDEITESEKEQNQFNLAQFPQPTCGDPPPTSASSYPLNFFPVFSQFSEENLQSIQSNFCQDALAKIRKDTGEQAIQVASFTRLEKAQEFSEFLQDKLGSGEVGEPTLVAQHPAQKLDDIPAENKQSVPESAAKPSPKGSPQFTEDETLIESQAISTIENLYTLLSTRQYDRAIQLFSPELASQFDPQFFEQFESVTVENLQVVSRSPSAIEFEGQNTYVYPDGSIQRELRSYTVANVDGESKITASEFIKVTQFR